MSHMIEVSELSNENLENHFVNKLNENLDTIREMAIDFVPNIPKYNTPLISNLERRKTHHNNSPLSLSDYESDSDSDSYIKPKKASHFRNLTHKEVEQSLDKYYDNSDNATKYSTELDIMTTYLKGQKNLYMQSMFISRCKLNGLLIPPLLISAAITIFAPFIQEYNWSGGFISGLNAIIILLISLVSYLKLETSVEMFHHTANQYDKMETSMEFVSSKMLFVQDENEKSRIVLDKIQEMERKISDVKEWNHLFIPEEVRQSFPIICNINIFTFIKRMEIQKQNLIAKFKDVKNEIRYILHLFAQNKVTQNTVVDTSANLIAHLENNTRQEKRLTFLLEIKDKIKEELFHYKNAYSHIDEIFTREIKRASHKKSACGSICCNGYTPETNSSSNPVIDQYLDFIHP